MVRLSVVVILISGCARTSITSRVSDELRLTRCSRILVIATIHDLAIKETLENKIRKSLEDNGVTSYVDNEEFFPGTAYSEIDYALFIQHRHIDGLLVAIPTDYGTSNLYIPPTTTSHTVGSMQSDGYGGFYYSQTTESVTRGGYTARRPWASFEVTLYDAGQGDPVWYATANTSGSILGGWKAVVKSLGGKTVKKMFRDGVLSTKQK
jgi:hypothetical protein